MILDNDDKIIENSRKESLRVRAEIQQEKIIEYVAEYLMYLFTLPASERINGDSVLAKFSYECIDQQLSCFSQWSFMTNLRSNYFTRGATYDLRNKQKACNWVREKMQEKIEELRKEFPAGYYLYNTLVY